MSGDHIGVKVNGVLYVKLEDARKLREGWDKADERIAELEAALQRIASAGRSDAADLIEAQAARIAELEELMNKIRDITEFGNPITCVAEMWGIARAALEGGKQ